MVPAADAAASFFDELKDEVSFFGILEDAAENVTSC